MVDDLVEEVRTKFNFAVSESLVCPFPLRRSFLGWMLYNDIKWNINRVDPDPSRRSWCPHPPPHQATPSRTLLAVLPSELAGATIVVQSRNGQSWTTTVTAILDRGSSQVIVTDSGRPSTP